MTRAQVKDFIEAGCNELSLGFETGRISEINPTPKSYPFAWLKTLSVSSELRDRLPIDAWAIELHILKLDKPGGDYETLVDECDEIAQRLVRLYNEEISGYKLVQLLNMKRDPSIHVHSDNTSGVILTFTLTGPDTTDLC